MRVSFITTVFNEEKTIEKLLYSLFNQSKLPDEIIIIDGGSKDRTVEHIKKIFSAVKEEKLKQIKKKVFVKHGNRSVGRNEAIRKATNQIIVCSDSGNILDKNWIKEITLPFNDKKVDVVAGYYQGKANTIFQKCVIPYALVMSDKVNPRNFLPATRSVAFKKVTWEQVGGFNESLSHNEDYVFARKLQQEKTKIVFAPKALVYWMPRNNLKQTFSMLWRFAFGDAEAGILRNTVIYLFTRYILGLYFIFLCLLYRSRLGFLLAGILLILYILWSIQKNYRYVNNKKAFLFLPIIQFTADAAVLSGTILGSLKQIKSFPIFTSVKNNKALIAVVSLYIFLELLVLPWGIPNIAHPFPYHMDEWHQLQAVRATFKYGTPNTAGAANGTMFHFILTGFYLAPFAILHFINPVELRITDFTMRERIFDLLRVNTIVWGMFSLTTFYLLLRNLRLPSGILLLLYTFTPVWLSLSNLFKYDIALMFWIQLSLLLIIRFAQNNSLKKFLIAGIPVGLAIAVKISAIPLFIIYLLSYFFFTQKKSWRVKPLLLGCILVVSITILFGMPDTLFGRGNILRYLFENIIQAPSESGNFELGLPPDIYLFTRHYPLIFGHALYYGTVVSMVLLLASWIKSGSRFSLKHYKMEIFFFLSLIIFALSVLPLGVYAGSNRSLVLLPFFIIVIGFTIVKLGGLRKAKLSLLVVFSLLLVLQILESLVWIQMKLVKSPQEVASTWITKNIPAKQIIGLENIPIYQYIPDITQKEFYYQQYLIKGSYRYNYLIIDPKGKKLPNYIVVTNDEISPKLFVKSPKNELLKRLQSEGYSRIAVFYPDYTYYKVYGNNLDYFLSSLVAAPDTIAIYKK
jgi:glycosyltransferase involved in cell wall biosynthesis